MNWTEIALMYDYVWAIVTFILSLTFLIAYGFSAPWWTTVFGRCLMAMDLGLCIATASTALLAIGVNVSAWVPYDILVAITAPLVPLAIGWRIKMVAEVWAGKRHRKNV